jgi:hypothetical protein
VVTEYSFGESPNKLGQPDFSPTFHDNMLKGLKSAAVVKHASFVGTIVESLPKSTAAKLFPPYAQLNKEKEVRTLLFIVWGSVANTGCRWWPKELV